ncbi:MAG: hypothetical protein P1V97_15340 [Planctomycetota bacterium]|nr:hypothetical protein [Planctomycetota bacterium]
MTKPSPEATLYQTQSEDPWTLLVDGSPSGQTWTKIEALPEAEKERVANLPKEEGFLSLPDEPDFERFNVILEELTLRFEVSKVLVEDCGGASRVLPVLQGILNTVPDRLRLYQDLSKGGKTNELCLFILGAESSPLALKSSKKVAVLNRELAKMGALGRAMLGVLVIRALRNRLPGPHGANRLKRDVGVALLVLGADAEAKSTVSKDSVIRDLSKVLREDDAFTALLGDLLDKNPLRSQMKIRPEENIFLDPIRFDSLSFGEKGKVILSGQLAWYTTLSFGFLWLFRSLWDRVFGYYSQGRQALTADLGKRGMFKKTLRRKVLPMLFKGRFLRAVELFWAGWNPNLTRVTLRPFFRFLGGNKRPFLATFGTFVFSGFVVHLMGITTIALVVAWSLLDSVPGAKLVASPTNINIQVNIWIVYLVFGFIVGLSKALRALGRRKEGG